MEYRFWYIYTMIDPMLIVRFYRSAMGTEPVREWLKSLPTNERFEIGKDIKVVQFRWPLGMPLVKKLHSKPNVWEVRTQLPNRISRVLFTVTGNEMVLLHAFVKKTQATPKAELKLAVERIDFEGGE